MPSHKDLKRLVRARMQKTGESYTAARAHLLKKKAAPPPTLPTGTDFARLAGWNDAVVEAKTGRSWKDWVKVLDQAGAAAWPHPRIAKYVHGEHGVPDWWTQTVTVGYERIKGLRTVGQRRDGTFETSKSKTFPVPLSRLYRAWSDSRVRAKWLPGIALTVRSATREKSMRFTWPDRTSIEVGFARRAAAKSQVAVQHSKLPDKTAIVRMKAFWEERLRALGSVLEASAR